jgi:hypothetical protein
VNSPNPNSIILISAAIASQHAKSTDLEIGERRAMLAVLAQTGVVYFTIFTPEFNHYVILLPLWAGDSMRSRSHTDG